MPIKYRADMALQRGAAPSFDIVCWSSAPQPLLVFLADRIGRALAHTAQRLPARIFTAPQKREAAASNALGNQIL
jgi:hypothetical protein